ncbi:MAG: pyridoxal-phosphate dependent enzyme, partial [Actinomycetota bacterium]
MQQQPSLDDLARIPIGRWPTPAVLLERVSERAGVEIWAKLEERCGAWGGNKVRKLEYWLAASGAAGRHRLVTVGAGASSWTAATVVHGARLGFDVSIGLAGPVPEPYEELYARSGARTTRLPNDRLMPLLYPLLRPRARLGGAAFLPAGGSGGWGDVGSMRAGIEIFEAHSSG